MKKFIVMVGMILLGIAIVALLNGGIQTAVTGLSGRAANSIGNVNPSPTSSP